MAMGAPTKGGHWLLVSGVETGKHMGIDGPGLGVWSWAHPRDLGPVLPTPED